MNAKDTLIYGKLQVSNILQVYNTINSTGTTTLNGNIVAGLNSASTFQYIGSTSIANATLVPASKLHIDGGTATASAIKFTAGTTTGQLSTDGFDIGIDTSGNAELRQRENLNLSIYTNNIERIKIDGTGNTYLSGATTIYNTCLANSYKSLSPSGGTAATWKLGSIITGATLVADLTRYIEVDINGVLYKIIIST